MTSPVSPFQTGNQHAQSMPPSGQPLPNESVPPDSAGLATSSAGVTLSTPQPGQSTAGVPTQMPPPPPPMQHQMPQHHSGMYYAGRLYEAGINPPL
ncbi:unnamed protein product [Protopolystoma xenopodis]|uniref:Uncharacterized protein n=1 Tax=Protopolystoma xenopodis TaxID=117903 RepID=A0A3S5BJK2_9PLAT|nr:unnamed protein product [Protopolystoma xenopodis]